jgi:hypothetical protein
MWCMGKTAPVEARRGGGDDAPVQRWAAAHGAPMREGAVVDLSNKSSLAKLQAMESMEIKK